MTLEQALGFIHCTPWQGSRPGLMRIKKLLHLLGDPQRTLRFVHVAGTNGKGSTCAMIASILSQAGYVTGLYTSPHLFRINERIQVNRVEITDDELVELCELLKPAVDAMPDDPPTEFERLTALGMLYFARRHCDFVVLEVGLGGRLDSTNAIDAPEVAVLTNIGLEHTELLGNTLTQIAAEKAGIIKPGCRAVAYCQSEEVLAVFRAECEQTGVLMTVTDPSLQHLIGSSLAGQSFDYRERRGLTLSLAGSYQYKNAALVLDAIDALRERGAAISEEAIRAGLANTVWPGRFEVLCQKPLVVVDGAHNANGVSELACCLSCCLPGRPIVFVMGVMADKDHRQMLQTLAPFAREFITVMPEHDRALPSAELCEEARQISGKPAFDAKTVEAGLQLALSHLQPEDALCICGSLYQVGQARAYFGLYQK